MEGLQRTQKNANTKNGAAQNNTDKNTNGCDFAGISSPAQPRQTLVLSFLQLIFSNLCDFIHAAAIASHGWT